MGSGHLVINLFKYPAVDIHFDLFHQDKAFHLVRHKIMGLPLEGIHLPWEEPKMLEEEPYTKPLSFPM